MRVIRRSQVRVRISPRVARVDAGAAGVLRCEVSGAPAPTAVQWYKDARALQPSAAHTITPSQGEPLQARGVGRLRTRK